MAQSVLQTERVTSLEIGGWVVGFVFISIVGMSVVFEVVLNAGVN
ncbi:hypothetical protein [Altererythrobacter lutimaris]|nr:hypothetical protein [Altererythrobacter lutimaris]